MNKENQEISETRKRKIPSESESELRETKLSFHFTPSLPFLPSKPRKQIEDKEKYLIEQLKLEKEKNRKLVAQNKKMREVIKRIIKICGIDRLGFIEEYIKK